MHNRFFQVQLYYYMKLNVIEVVFSGIFPFYKTYGTNSLFHFNLVSSILKMPNKFFKFKMIIEHEVQTLECH